MDNLDFDMQISGFARCPDCAYTWSVVVPYGRFFALTCPICGGLVGELEQPMVAK